MTVRKAPIKTHCPEVIFRGVFGPNTCSSTFHDHPRLGRGFLDPQYGLLSLRPNQPLERDQSGRRVWAQIDLLRWRRRGLLELPRQARSLRPWLLRNTGSLERRSLGRRFLRGSNRISGYSGAFPRRHSNRRPTSHSRSGHASGQQGSGVLFAQIPDRVRTTT